MKKIIATVVAVVATVTAYKALTRKRKYYKVTIGREEEEGEKYLNNLRKNGAI